MRLKHHHELDRKIDDRPDLVILSGESGSGKSTLIDMLRWPEEKTFTESYAMIDELNRRGEPINHDAIFALAQELYGKDPLWQVPNIIAKVALEGCLIWDGPRRAPAVLEMKKRDDINTTVVRVVADQDKRCTRLSERDGISEDAFLRIIHDESEGAGLNQVLGLADITVHNNGDLRQLQIASRAISGLLKYNPGENRSES